jgi:ribosome-binding factor A
MTRRQERVGEEIHRELSVLIQRESRDPRLAGVTVTGVKVSADLRWATVFATALGEAEQQAQALAGLKHAASFLRRELAARLNLRRVPELTFEIDQSVAHTRRILDLIDQIHTDSEVG